MQNGRFFISTGYPVKFRLRAVFPLPAFGTITKSTGHTVCAIPRVITILPVNSFMIKRLPSVDIGLLATFAMNVYLIWSYLKTPAFIDTIILLFYVQSVLIGVFNVLDIFTLTKTTGDSPIKSSKGCTGLFFMVHYGAFHLVYLFFLPTIINIKNIDWHFALLTFYILLSTCIINFIQDKWRNRTEAVNVGAMFFMPYARVIPMHLTILAPKFFNISAPVVFLILKTLADILTYTIYKRAVFKPIPPAKHA